ncbi:DUF1281 family ferredoxin-like fold protein [Acidihalobacter prosperus]|uniref:YubB ferredoxin-like domain-containing protein n=1 Tax=Acidihalobacter prosperus TaxID=160660 RepID=A0A1A6C351_9GAMM|nr:hypothetical protein [Acidihalobacter prosperus]OBS08984.1 hypothetical protein Thpro_022101 [Acidihalobacter prosperus]
MPNHVINRVVVVDGDPEALRQFLSQNDEGESYFDFEKLVPMPESLNIQSGSVGRIGHQLYYSDNPSVLDYWIIEKIRAYREAHPECAKLSDLEVARVAYKGSEEERLGHLYEENRKRYGATTWYEWACNNWGTKWNAYDYDEVDGLREFVFDTAWSPAEPIYRKLAEILPEHRILIGCFDEGSCFACLYVLQDGELEVTYIDTGDNAFYAACYGVTEKFTWDDEADEEVEIELPETSLVEYAVEHDLFDSEVPS